jgi:hypothetical protein
MRIIKEGEPYGSAGTIAGGILTMRDSEDLP